MPKERACRNCKYITSEKRCQNCGSTSFSENWAGLIFILNPEESKIAKLVNAKTPGFYAHSVA